VKDGIGRETTGQFGLRFQLPRKSQGSFTCRNSATWDRRLYLPSERRHAVDFIARKIRLLLSGSNLQCKWGWNRQCSETLAFELQALVNSPEEIIRRSERGERLKSRTSCCMLYLFSFKFNFSYLGLVLSVGIVYLPILVKYRNENYNFPFRDPFCMFKILFKEKL
jgi:hypothetical protein